MPRDDRLLLLFDIDGTLVTGATAAHAAALHDALLSVHGVDAGALPEPPSPAGRTDGEIARLILRAAGLPEAEIDAGAAAVRELCCRLYERYVEDDLSHTVLPGVPELLRAVARDDRFVVALLTGNFEPVARRKLSAARIGEFFAPGQGAFGSDAEARVDLPAIARRRAGAASDPGASTGPHPRERTLVIGDTPRDIACARADGVRCIGIASGPFGAEELREADRVAADAVALRELLAQAV